MKKATALFAAATVCAACASDTARPPALGDCVSQADASCVGPPAAGAGTQNSPDSGSVTGGGAAPSATSDAGGAGTSGGSAFADSGSAPSSANADAAQPTSTGSE